MNVVLWVIAILLGLAFLAVGLAKVATPREKLLANPNMAWTEDFAEGPIKLIGVAEILGAIGLILPRGIGFAQWLTPAAAIGLFLLMVGAAFTHLRRGERKALPINIVLGVLAAIVAVGRF